MNGDDDIVNNDQISSLQQATWASSSIHLIMMNSASIYNNYVYKFSRWRERWDPQPSPQHLYIIYTKSFIIPTYPSTLLDCYHSPMNFTDTTSRVESHSRKQPWKSFLTLLCEWLIAHGNGDDLVVYRVVITHFTRRLLCSFPPMSIDCARTNSVILTVQSQTKFLLSRPAILHSQHLQKSKDNFIFFPSNPFS